MATLENVEAQLRKLQAQAEQIKAKSSALVVRRIRDLMTEHGLTIADLSERPTTGAARGRSSTKTPSAPGEAKYRDPATGASWSGRGRVPGWIAGAKDKTKFLVDGLAPIASTLSPEKKKTGKYPRGPQPAKFRDPKSGATWSGRGKAPAWLAAAKDRTKFLIDGAADGTSFEVIGRGAGGSTKKAVAQKVATKKGSKKVTAVRALAGASESAPTSKAVGKKAAKKVAKKAGGKKKVAAKKVAARGPGKKTARVAANFGSTRGAATKKAAGKSAAASVESTPVELNAASSEAGAQVAE
ncbi:hypothetical protein BTHE68_41070 [Burkholderia sp. THE68]|uniref:H-NS family nucleoid-associated regulatory protein n=1 Tax=Burkholderia sp. THE68 TaxID=758782 RepID=UPI0013185603|nr:H-NS family nucleoid-associated regulatory protein [Burkholderia sp. THE68]BBU30373.1 hypothetical protein BTHE68_41070 [Burkholderia sp. THE68]